MRVLAIGAHPDDIELGCGGALLRHAAAGDHITILVVTRGERGVADDRSRFAAQRRAARVLGADLRWGTFVDGEVTFGPGLVQAIDEVLESCGADIVYTHAVEDSHQDHCAISRASLAASRRLSSVLFYESESTQRFHPTVFINVSGLIEAKLALAQSPRSQDDRSGPVELDALVAQARFRGSQARTGYAEGFEVGRFLWQPGPVVPDATATEADTESGPKFDRAPITPLRSVRSRLEILK